MKLRLGGSKWDPYEKKERKRERREEKEGKKKEVKEGMREERRRERKGGRKREKIGPYKFSHLTLILKDTSTRIL